MTAFDNIKTNNWPATSNDFEDFLVLKMPLNDNASLTESLPVVAGSQELFPKRTLTNSGGVNSVQTRYVANVKLHTYIYNTPGTLTVNGNTVPRGNDPNGDVTFTVAVNGALNSIAWSYDSSSGPYCYMRGIEVDLGDGNGYQLIQDGSFGVAAYSSLISGTVDSNYPLSNLFGGTIGTSYTNGTRSTNPGTLTLDLSSVFSLKKHYDNNAYFSGNAYMQLAAADSVFNLGVDDFCIEYYFKADNLSSAYKLFQLGVEINWTENVEMQMNTNGTIDYDIYPGSSVAQSNYGFTGTQTFSAGTWNHVALTRQGSTFRGFLNGVADGSTTYAGIISSPTLANNRPSFGCRTNGSVTTISGPRLVGSIQDFRLYRGTAKYTSNFTPPGAILG